MFFLRLSKYVWLIGVCGSLFSEGCATVKLKGNGVVTTENRDAKQEILYIEANSSVSVELIYSNEQFIRVKGDSNLISYMRTEILDNGRLIIEPTISMNVIPSVVVGTTSVAGIKLTKSSCMYIQRGYDSDKDVSLDVSKSSRIDGSWSAKHMKIRADMSSAVALGGAAASLDVLGTRSSTINLLKLQNQGNAGVILDRSSQADISGGSLQSADVSRSSKLNFYGDCSRASIRQQRSGTVNCLQND